MKKKISATFRIAISLGALSVSLLLAAQMMGMLPSEHRALMRGRSMLCESLAVNFSLLANRADFGTMEKGLEVIKHRNPAVISIAVRRANGDFLAQAGDHDVHWKDPPLGRSTETHVYVPIMSASERWGTVEICFQPIRAAGVAGILQLPVVKLALFMMAAGTGAYFLFLRRVLRHLNPSKVVPSRVRAALDTLAEGLLVLDNHGKIVLANQAFGQTVSRSPEDLMGRDASDLPWSRRTKEAEGGPHQAAEAPPWSKVLDDGQPRTGELMGLDSGDAKNSTFVVNATPIHDAAGTHRGVLASFDDVTDLENKRVELSETLDKLSQSSAEIQRQNVELEQLATRDPLTACFNRRSFFEQFEAHWSNSSRHNYSLSCVMLDIDHFKSINDTFGHQAGDKVLKQIAQVLHSAARDGDVVCRYGGEEFAVLLPHVGIDDATSAAERFRAAIEAFRFPDMTVTASLGVSTRNGETQDPQELLEQADKSMYVAKRGGRNQVVRWDKMPEDAEVDQSGDSRPADDSHSALDSIPFQAVTGLFSALAYRDLDTAEHSRRVADLCVATAEGLTSLRDCYLLEIAALMHDIGKVGVPDSILLKPGALTDDEWKVMRRHDRVGQEIVEASFGTQKLTTIVANHSAHYGGSPHNAALPKGNNIPLGARILSIADAYDSMVSDRVYRKGRRPKEAFDELRRCAGSQFDPELVELFIQTVQQRRDLHETGVQVVSKKAATSIGRQISRLISALESRDTDGLQSLAGRLKGSAEKHGVPEIATKAANLESALDAGSDAIGILKSATELVDLCRATQRAFLKEIDETGADHPAPTETVA
jgi:diguanylate cyclase (GGDEF)-like protein